MNEKTLDEMFAFMQTMVGAPGEIELKEEDRKLMADGLFVGGPRYGIDSPPLGDVLKTMDPRRKFILYFLSRSLSEANLLLRPLGWNWNNLPPSLSLVAEKELLVGYVTVNKQWRRLYDEWWSRVVETDSGYPLFTGNPWSIPF